MSFSKLIKLFDSCFNRESIIEQWKSPTTTFDFFFFKGSDHLKKPRLEEKNNTSDGQVNNYLAAALNW